MRLAMGAAAVVAVVAVVRAWPGGRLAFGLASPPRAGEPAPPLEATTLDGRRLDLESLRGRVVLVNFWATWCGPCLQEMPAIERLWREREGDGFVALGLSADASAADVVPFLAEESITYPIAMASPAARRDYGVTAFPSSFIVDRRGVVRHQVLGAAPEAMLREIVGRLLAEPAPARSR